METRLLEFITETTKSLGRIEAFQEIAQKERSELKIQCDKIPRIETGLNNHLTAHNRLKNLFIYPLSVSIGSGMVIAFLHYICKLF